MENLLIIHERKNTVAALVNPRDYVPVYNGVANATLANAKSVQFLTKKTNGKIISSVVIPFESITSLTLQKYKAPILPVLRIGNNTTAPTGLQVASTGEATIIVNNRAYARAHRGRQKNVSKTKLVSQTPVQFLTAMVAELNAMTVEQGKFFTAELQTSGANHHILITALDRNADIDVQCDGMFAGTVVTVIEPGFIGLGVGEDVVEMETDFTKNSGNLGYIERNELWYKEEIESKKNELYNALTISWKGHTTVGSATEHVANNTLTLFAKALNSLPLDVFAAIPGCPKLETEETEEV